MLIMAGLKINNKKTEILTKNARKGSWETDWINKFLRGEIDFYTGSHLCEQGLPCTCLVGLKVDKNQWPL